jgi:spermidine synthase
MSQTFSFVEYAYTTIPTYPFGQIGFIVATKGPTTCKQLERKPSDKVQADLKYYSPKLHQAAFILPAFARRAISGEK